MVTKELETIKKLISDGCTGVPELIFHGCCEQHDKDYDTIGKIKADVNFFKCCWHKSDGMKWYKDCAYKSASVVYFLGVSALGWLFYRGESK